MFKMEDGIFEVEDRELHNAGEYWYHYYRYTRGKVVFSSFHWYKECRTEPSDTSFVRVKYCPRDWCGSEEFYVQFPDYKNDEHYLLAQIGKSNNGVWCTELSVDMLMFYTLEDLNNTFERFVEELSKM